MIRGENKQRCPHCQQEIEGDMLYIIQHVTVCSAQAEAQKQSKDKYDKKDFKPKQK